MITLRLAALLLLACDGGAAAPPDAPPADAADPCLGIGCGHGACLAGGCVCDAGWVGAACDACDDGFFPAGAACVAAIRFALPMAAAQVTTPVLGVDHAAGAGASNTDCQSHDCAAFPACYDGHDGTDFILAGGFTTMDMGSTPVLAAADGVVLETHDGEFDRCSGNLATGLVTCDGGAVTPANHVKLEHADGSQTWYWHLARDSVLVAVGATVVCGQPLGLVGSSGNSAMPHLHFEVLDPAGLVVDPFSGTCSQPESRWLDQGGTLPGGGCQGM